MAFVRSKNNPILKPDSKSPWESVMVYNPGAIYENDKYHLFYRAVGHAWISKIGHSISTDGETFKNDRRPILAPELQIEKNGCEDPRITKVGSHYLLSYNAYDGETARLCLAISDDLENWKRQGEMFPGYDAIRAGSFRVHWDPAQRTEKARRSWNKAGGIFPAVIDHKYWMIYGDRNLWMAASLDGYKWKTSYTPFLTPRPGYFDSVHVEMGPPPIRTEKGWLVIYHGVDNNITYRLGYILLDINDPTKIIHRSETPIFEPSEPYEISGLVDLLPGGFKTMEMMSREELLQYIKKAKADHTLPTVIFCNGAVLVDDQLRIYYGAADSVVCTATVNISNLL